MTPLKCAISSLYQWLVAKGGVRVGRDFTKQPLGKRIGRNRIAARHHNGPRPTATGALAPRKASAAAARASRRAMPAREEWPSAIRLPATGGSGGA